MKHVLALLLLLGPAGYAGAAYEEEGLTEAAVSTETAKSGEEEEAQPVIQETDEDLAAFVTDYIRKDVQLKGAFLIESRADKKILKLDLVSVAAKAAGGDAGAKTVTATFKDQAGKRHTALFHLQNGPWGGLDIFKIELKSPKEKTGAGKK